MSSGASRPESPLRGPASPDPSSKGLPGPPPRHTGPAPGLRRWEQVLLRVLLRRQSLACTKLMVRGTEGTPASEGERGGGGRRSGKGGSGRAQRGLL